MGAVLQAACRSYQLVLAVRGSSVHRCRGGATMRAGNLHQFQKAAAAFKKGSKIGMRDMRVGLGKHFEASPALVSETTAILERLPTSPEESAQLDHEDMWKQIKYVLSEEKKIRKERFEPAAVKLCKLSAHQADQLRTKWPKH